MKNSYESMEDMRRMQQEAIIRVHEMQKRAKKSLEAGHQFEPSTNTKDCEVDKKNPTMPNAPPALPLPKNIFPPTKGFPINNILETFFKDSEKSLILILILLMVEENGDMSLILALMYLMM